MSACDRAPACRGPEVREAAGKAVLEAERRVDPDQRCPQHDARPPEVGIEIGIRGSVRGAAVAGREQVVEIPVRDERVDAGLAR